jgi:hypothetical protein
MVIKGKVSVSRKIVSDLNNRLRKGNREIADRSGRGKKKKDSLTLIKSIIETLENNLHANKLMQIEQ